MKITAVKKRSYQVQIVESSEGVYIYMLGCGQTYPLVHIKRGNATVYFQTSDVPARLKQLVGAQLGENYEKPA